jgi:pimeloyl-ACP methyl ester carboxylesterase
MIEPISFEDFGGQGPVLHFAHPNAYPPACFAQMLLPLADTYHVIAMHHRPLWPGSRPEEFKSWQVVADDLYYFLEQQGVQQVIGVGHSLGAVATMKVAWQHPQLFRALVLIEPVFLEPQILHMLAVNPAITEDLPMVQKALKRRNSWPDRQTAFDRYRAKAVFKRWPDEALWYYVNEGLVETADGDLTLSFSREWEAKIYSRFPQGVWEELPRLTQPTLAIRGAESDTLSTGAWELWKERQPAATYVEISGVGHMAPMEKPDEVVAAINEFLIDNPGGRG